MRELARLGVIVVLVSGWPGAVHGGEAEAETSATVLTQQELERYRFPAREQAFSVQAVDAGQRYLLQRQRREVLDALRRHVGVMQLRGDEGDLDALQQLAERGVVADDDAAMWQAMGVVLGDVIANRLGLHWVAVEDELGRSRALRWRETDNFVFPVTLLSRRKQFGQAVDVAAVYGKVSDEVAAFKAWQARQERSRQERSQ